jgi:hypothetical protein
MIDISNLDSCWLERCVGCDTSIKDQIYLTLMLTVIAILPGAAVIFSHAEVTQGDCYRPLLLQRTSKAPVL